MIEDRKNNRGRPMDILYHGSLLFLLKGPERRNQNPKSCYSSHTGQLIWKRPGTRNPMPPKYKNAPEVSPGKNLQTITLRIMDT